jgi:hypothetical protein
LRGVIGAPRAVPCGLLLRPVRLRTPAGLTGVEFDPRPGFILFARCCRAVRHGACRVIQTMPLGGRVVIRPRRAKTEQPLWLRRC